MRDRKSIARFFGIIIALGLAAVTHGVARADVYGRLQITVNDADTEKPVAGATVTLHDTAGVVGDITLSTGADGTVTTGPLQNRAWAITAAASGYDPTSQNQTVVADVTTPVEIDIEKPEKVIKITSTANHINASNPTVSNTIGPTIIKTYAASSNNQNLGQTLAATVPGVVGSSFGAFHIGGEHASQTFYLDGIEIPGQLPGRESPVFSPEVIQNLDVITGGFAPEYGSEAAAIFNISLKSGPITPYVSMYGEGGSYGTYEGGIEVAGQAGYPIEKVESGPAPLDFRYYLDLDSRSTDIAAEAPQPDDPTAHNAGQSSTVLGNFQFIATPKDTLSMFISSAPAQTEIANRSGLPSSFADDGEGYGYGGLRDANGTVPTANMGSLNPSNPVGTFGATLPSNELDSNGLMPSQQELGNNINQSDGNTFGFLTYRHEFSASDTALLSVGDSQSRIDITNNNQSPGDLADLPVDSSDEFNPTVHNQSNQQEVDGSLTQAGSTHTFKEGFVYQNQEANESMQFVPDSQIALDALAGIDVNNAGQFVGRLTPAGSFVPGEYDVYGNQVYQANPGAVAPTLDVRKVGYYTAAYAQDTWKLTRKLNANYGLRFDQYYQSISLNDGVGTVVNQGDLSPRVNLSYAFQPTTVGFLSFDRLFTQPPLAQGAAIGNVGIKPETWNQYDASVEHQLAPRQIMKIRAYYKQIENQDDTGILIPDTQIGVYTTLNYQFASIHGYELSYDVAAKNNIGWAGYFNYTRSHAAPGGLDQSGNPAPIINDHDQRDTFNAGTSWTATSQAFVALDGYYGSGEASSSLPIFVYPHPTPRYYANLRLASSPNVLGHGSVELDVDNIFNELPEINFDSGFSGTRFQEPRTFLISANQKF